MPRVLDREIDASAFVIVFISVRGRGRADCCSHPDRIHFTYLIEGTAPCDCNLLALGARRRDGDRVPGRFGVWEQGAGAGGNPPQDRGLRRCRSRARSKNEIPGNELAAVMAAHYQGLGDMEQFKYREAGEAFREARKRAPGWIAGSINLAIALLNDSGVKAEEAKKAGDAPPADNFDEALELLAGVLDREPDNPHAHFCRGLILEQRGNFAEAHSHFKTRDGDRSRPTRRRGTGLACTIPETGDATKGRSRAAAIKERAKQEIVFLKKALELNPYLTPAVYRFAMASRFAMTRKESTEWFDRFRKINPDQPDRCPGRGRARSAKAYGEMGPYGNIVNSVPASRVGRGRARGPRRVSRRLGRLT